jgi:LysM repeat protein
MVYTVEEGDTLSKIARRYNVSLEALEKSNPAITDPDKIVVGWQLQIPAPSTPAPAYPTPQATVPCGGVQTVADFIKADLNLVDGPPVPKLAWGSKVSVAFKRRVVEIAKEIECEPNYLMAAMAFETG